MEKLTQKKESGLFNNLEMVEVQRRYLKSRKLVGNTFIDW